jgi:cell division septation protein DedD
VNATVLLISAWVAGADAAPAPAAAHPAPAPAVVTGDGCNNCGSSVSCCEPDCKGPSLLDRLRARFSKANCCEPACSSGNTCSTPVVVSCQPCCEPACKGPGFLARLRNKFRKNDCCDPCAIPNCENCGPTGCSLAPAPSTVHPAAPVEAPKAMPMTQPAPIQPMPMTPPAPKTAPEPKPAPEPKTAPAPKTTQIEIPQVAPVSNFPAAPVLISPASKF